MAIRRTTKVRTTTRTIPVRTPHGTRRVPLRITTKSTVVRRTN